jgi:hypothetical protein
MTEEQRREAWLSDTVAGLWNRWLDSGPNDVSRGWDRPFAIAGLPAVRIQITRADVRDLVKQIEAEYGQSSGHSQ